MAIANGAHGELPSRPNCDPDLANRNVRPENTASASAKRPSKPSFPAGLISRRILRSSAPRAALGVFSGVFFLGVFLGAIDTFLRLRTCKRTSPSYVTSVRACQGDEVSEMRQLAPKNAQAVEVAPKEPEVPLCSLWRWGHARAAR